MKRLFVILAALLIGFTASARGGFLVKAGVSNSNMDLNKDVASVISDDLLSGAFFKNFTGYHVGVGYRTGTWSGLRFQPELLYNVRGTRVDDATRWTMGYLEMPLNLQWGLDLIVMRPFIQVAPCIGYDFMNKTTSSPAGNALGNVTTDANRLEYGLSVGGGLDILNSFQISVNYNWNFGPVANLTAYQDRVAGIERKNARCLQVSLAYIF
ncbi:MAG: PorT family protein [Bacteroidales bacterium]|nr:PorT family protein [Bacteroidales bacterium]